MQRWVTVSINTQWYASDIAVNILIATQLKAKECYSGQHIIKRWVATELPTCHEHLSHWIMSWTHHLSLVHRCHICHLQNFEHVMNTSSIIGLPLSYLSFAKLWTCHEHISHWFTIVILVISRTLNMSWTHQSLVHHCHISHLQNFEHVMNTSVIGSSLSYQSFTELWTCHEHISHWVIIAMSVIYRILNMLCQSRTELIFFENINISSNIAILSSPQSWTKYHSKVWTQ